MDHPVPPTLANKFGEPGGLFDTVLQRLVAEWHRFQVDRDPHRLPTLNAILDAGMSQLRSLELLLAPGTDDPTAGPDQRRRSAHGESQGVGSVYLVDPRQERRSHAEAGERRPPVSPSRLDEALQLLESLQEALREVLHSEPPQIRLSVSGQPEPARAGRSGEPSRAAGNGSARAEAALGGILSHEAFDVAAAAELKRCRRFERAFSLLLLDLGKEADSQAARVLLANLREFDLVGRYGDEVFALGLSETSAEGARMIALRLVGLLARRGTWSDRGHFGIATYPKDGNTLTMVVRSARSQLAGEASL
jgi:GGDEF domain-containing protein